MHSPYYSYGSLAFFCFALKEPNFEQFFFWEMALGVGKTGCFFVGTKKNANDWLGVDEFGRFVV
jgi:hypothetical protein